MIGLIIAAIAYLIASTGTYGGNLIYMLDVLENWYWIILVLTGILALGITVLSTATGTVIGNESGTTGKVIGSAAGFAVGGIISILILLKIGLQLYLTTWLMSDIDPAIVVDFDALSNKQMMAFVIILVLAFIPLGGSYSNNTQKKV